MKIVFLCGSLEPGRDGVGDYTRRLTQELIKSNYEVGIVALNDPYITDYFEGVQHSGSVDIPVLRIPSSWLSKERFRRTKLWVNNLNPEWISLQFVPFSLHPKGLYFGTSKSLAKLGYGRRWHIMVHELWVGMNKEASLKFVFWGLLQKGLIKYLFAKLKPNIIHTQSTLYKKMIEKIGFNAHLLPLFGNIPVTSERSIKSNDTATNISFVVFGGIHPAAPVKELVGELKAYSISRGIKIELTMIGRCGKEQLVWGNECKNAGLSIQIWGEQSLKVISEVLNRASFGIATTPPSLIEKSGSVAAMREHGLNILCVSRAWNPRSIASVQLPDGIVQYKPGQIEKFIKDNFKSRRSNNITDITNQFINSLSLRN